MTVVEQLDRAAGELRTDHPINNRLALILVDNATELVIERRCSDHVREDKEYRTPFAGQVLFLLETLVGRLPVFGVVMVEFRST